MKEAKTPKEEKAKTPKEERPPGTLAVIAKPLADEKLAKKVGRRHACMAGGVGEEAVAGGGGGNRWPAPPSRANSRF